MYWMKICDYFDTRAQTSWLELSFLYLKSVKVCNGRSQHGFQTLIGIWQQEPNKDVTLAKAEVF